MKIKKMMWSLFMLVVLAWYFLLTGPLKSHAASPGDKMPAGVEVKIDNFSFGSTMSLTVSAGTTVTWINDDDVPHTVVSDDKTTFKSKALDTGEKFSYTFTKPGKYPYFCSVHPKMMAEVVVQ